MSVVRSSGSNANILSRSKAKSVSDTINILKKNVQKLKDASAVAVIKYALEFKQLNQGKQLSKKAQGVVKCAELFETELKKEIEKYEQEQKRKIIPWEKLKDTGVNQTTKVDPLDVERFVAAYTSRGSIPIAQFQAFNEKKQKFEPYQPEYTTKTAPRSEWFYQACVKYAKTASEEEVKTINELLTHAALYVRSGGNPTGQMRRLTKLWTRKTKSGRLGPLDPRECLMKISDAQLSKQQSEAVLITLCMEFLSDLGISLSNYSEERRNEAIPVNRARYGLPYPTRVKTDLSSLELRDETIKGFIKICEENSDKSVEAIAEILLDGKTADQFNVMAANKVELMLKSDMDVKVRTYYPHGFPISYTWGQIFHAITRDDVEGRELSPCAYGLAAVRREFHKWLTGSEEPIKLDTERLLFKNYGDDVVVLHVSKGKLTACMVDMQGFDQSVHRIWPAILIDSLYMASPEAKLPLFTQVALTLWKIMACNPRVAYFGRKFLQETAGNHSGVNWTTQLNCLVVYVLYRLSADNAEDAQTLLRAFIATAYDFGFFPKEDEVVVEEVDLKEMTEVKEPPVNSWGTTEHVVFTEVSFVGFNIAVKMEKEGEFYLVPWRKAQDAFDSLLNMSKADSDEPDAVKHPLHVCEVALGIAISACGDKLTYEVCRRLFDGAKNVLDKNKQFKPVKLKDVDIGLEELTDVGFSEFPSHESILRLFQHPEGKLAQVEQAQQPAASSSGSLLKSVALEAAGVAGIDKVDLPKHTGPGAKAFNTFTARQRAMDNPKPVAPPIPAVVAIISGSEMQVWADFLAKKVISTSNTRVPPGFDPSASLAITNGKEVLVIPFKKAQLVSIHGEYYSLKEVLPTGKFGQSLMINSRPLKPEDQAAFAASVTSSSTPAEATAAASAPAVAAAAGSSVATAASSPEVPPTTPVKGKVSTPGGEKPSPAPSVAAAAAAGGVKPSPRVKASDLIKGMATSRVVTTEAKSKEVLSARGPTAPKFDPDKHERLERARAAITEASQQRRRRAQAPQEEEDDGEEPDVESSAAQEAFREEEADDTDVLYGEREAAERNDEDRLVDDIESYFGT